MNLVSDRGIVRGGRIACGEAAWFEFNGLLFGVRFVAVFGELWETAVGASIPIGVLFVGPSSFKFLIAARAAESLIEADYNSQVEPEHEWDEDGTTKMRRLASKHGCKAAQHKTGGGQPKIRPQTAIALPGWCVSTIGH
jgi:hypothetical protein